MAAGLDTSSTLSSGGASFESGGLKRVILLLWQERLTLLTFIGAGIVIALLLVFLSPDRHRASMTIAPVATSANSNAFSGAGAALSLLSGGGPSSEDFNRFQALLTSYQVAEQITQNPKILKIVIPKVRIVNNHVRYQPGLLSRLKAFVLGYPTPTITPAMVEELLVKKVAFENNSAGSLLPGASSPIVGMSFESEKPADAKTLIGALFRFADGIMREQQIAITQGKISYYKQTLAKSLTESERQYLYQAMVQEQSEVIRLRSGAPTGAQIVDAIHAPDKPVYPQPFPILVAGIFGALTLGIFYVLTGLWWRGAL